MAKEQSAKEAYDQRYRKELHNYYGQQRNYLNQLSFQQYQLDQEALRADYQAQLEAYREQERVRREGMKNAADAYRTDRRDSYARMLQEVEAARAELEDLKISGLQQRARARTAAGEAGVAGKSVQSQADELVGQEGTITARMGRQREMSVREYKRQQESLMNTYKNRINQLQPGVPPSMAALAIRMKQARFDYQTRNYQNSRLFRS